MVGSRVGAGRKSWRDKVKGRGHLLIPPGVGLPTRCSPPRPSVSRDFLLVCPFWKEYGSEKQRSPSCLTFSGPRTPGGTRPRPGPHLEDHAHHWQVEAQARDRWRPLVHLITHWEDKRDVIGDTADASTRGQRRLVSSPVSRQGSSFSKNSGAMICSSEWNRWT